MKKLQSRAKDWQKLRNLRKTFHHRRNIHGIYNEQLQYSHVQQLSTLKFNGVSMRVFNK